MRKHRGFTLIELMVVLAITALLVTLAAPSFKRMIQSNSVSSGVNSFLADLRYARSEAIRRGGNVVMCRSDNPEDAAPTCGTGAGTGGVGWASGWIVFLDKSSPANGQFDSGTDTLLRAQAANASIGTIADNPQSTLFKFTATGRMLGTDNTAALSFGGSSFDTTVQRVVCVGLGGRARIAGSGTATCGSTNE